MRASQCLSSTSLFWVRKMLGMLTKMHGLVQPLSWMKEASMGLLWKVPFESANMLAVVPGRHMIWSYPDTPYYYLWLRTWPAAKYIYNQGGRGKPFNDNSPGSHIAIRLQRLPVFHACSFLSKPAQSPRPIQQRYGDQAR